MSSPRLRIFLAGAVLAAVAPQAARAHFIWLQAAPGRKPGATVIQAFFNEDPEPDPKFV
ncbi:hypothetical protein HK102_008335, partial [Quaeritorhiza haematococci]